MNVQIPGSLIPQDPDSQVGLVFRRLAAIREFGEPALERAVRAALVVLGRAAHEEAEARARHLAERASPPPPTVRVSAHARRIDADEWDPGDRT